MITADQLLAHAIGDYLLQSDWLARNKTKRHWPAALHAVTYALPFLCITRSPAALAVIVSTHFVIDRWRLARFVVRVKNLAFSSWDEAWVPFNPATGAPKRQPAYLAVWLLIITDNVLHVLINGVALRCL